MFVQVDPFQTLWRWNRPMRWTVPVAVCIATASGAWSLSTFGVATPMSSNHIQIKQT